MLKEEEEDRRRSGWLSGDMRTAANVCVEEDVGDHVKWWFKTKMADPK